MASIKEQAAVVKPFIYLHKYSSKNNEILQLCNYVLLSCLKLNRKLLQIPRLLSTFCKMTFLALLTKSEFKFKATFTYNLLYKTNKNKYPDKTVFSQILSKIQE